MKDKKGIKITNAFQKFLKESNRKTKQNMGIDKGSEFSNRSMKSFLQNNNTEMYSIHNEETSVIAKRFIRTLENKMCKYMTAISKKIILIN